LLTHPVAASKLSVPGLESVVTLRVHNQIVC
jgi:hypothetical protein